MVYARVYSAIAVGCIYLVFGATLAKADDDAPAPERSEWFWPVAVAPDAPEDVRAVAQDLRESLGTIVIEGNAGCCLWIDMTLPTLNPAEPGYIVVLRSGGGKIEASDVQQLRAAADRLKELIEMQDGQPTLPHGLFTSFDVID